MLTSHLSHMVIEVLQVSRKCTFSGFLHWIIRNKVKHPGLPVLVSFILYHHHQIGAVFISHLLYLNRQMLKFMLKNLILALNSENVFLQTWRFLYRCVLNLCPYKDSKMLKKQERLNSTKCKPNSTCFSVGQYVGCTDILFIMSSAIWIFQIPLQCWTDNIPTVAFKWFKCTY